MENILQGMRKLYPLSDHSLEEMQSCMTRLEYPKRSFIVRSGSMNQNIYFIEKGITRSFFYHNGEEITTWFSTEGDVTFGMGSLYYNQPATENVETIEPCILYVIPIARLNALYEKNIEIANWGRILHQDGYYKITHIHVDRLRLSSQERYQLFTDYFPRVVNRVKLKYIASFLGMSIYTLSRVRALKC